LTQAGNDGVQAYRNGIRALDGKRYVASQADSTILREGLMAARRALLVALEVASRRYPWAASPVTASTTTTATDATS